MAPPSVAGALVGGYLAGRVPKTALLLVIAAVLLLQRARPAAAPPAPRRGCAAEFSRRGGGRLRSRDRPARRLRRADPRLAAHARAAAARRASRPRAQSGRTSRSASASASPGCSGHLPSAAPDWRLIAVGGGASIPAALIGARLTGRLSEPALDPRDRLRPARRRPGRGDSGVRLSLDALEESRRPLRGSAPAPPGTACARSPRTAPTRRRGFPRANGSTSSGVHSSWRPEVISVGTSSSPSRSITSHSFSVPVTVNSFGPHIVS